MSGTGLFKDPDEVIREAEQRDEEIERIQEPMEERGHGEGSSEPGASDDEEAEDNDGGPPASHPA
ncbi:MAG: hypothetical protein H0W81_09880 [Chloroflexi bacterium]|nr:hypothetical protein [Chloroflexota bacterium]